VLRDAVALDVELRDDDRALLLDRFGVVYLADA